MRRISVPLAAIAAVALLQGVSAHDAHTTRIETRPYYGAVVTVEHGVRVYRPIPPTEHMIINPEGATPVVLNGGDRVIIDHKKADPVPKVPQGR